MILKWGIVSAGKISNDFVMALKTFQEYEHKILAVAARDVTRAKEFANEFKIEKYYGNYNELCKNPDIDIVYIGAINTYHYDIAMLMMQNNKHVLCEKPLTMNSKQTTELIGIAKNKKLLLVEGIWSRFFPIYDHINEVVYNNGAFGDVRQITVSLGFCLSDVDRLMKKELGGGTILDLGIYCLQFALYVYQEEEPLSVKAHGCLNDDGVDTFMSATLTFSGNRTATITTNSLVELPNEAVIYGTNGVMRIPNFWCPTELTFKTNSPDIPEKTIKRQLPALKKQTIFKNSIGFIYEIQNIWKYFQTGLNSQSVEHGLEKVPYKTSIILAKLMDEIHKQLNVVYHSD